MAIASRLQDFLAARQTAYEVLSHPRTMNSMSSAQAAHVPGRRVAKAVVVDDGRRYFIAVLPATHHVALSDLGKALHRKGLRLASEAELKDLFGDCELGALPPVGAAYEMPAVIEEELDAQPEIYFEAGDHEHMVHVSQAEFFRLTSDVPRAHFSRIDNGLARVAGGDS
jgi:Ala-tRNA(Pro) deacylase